MAIHVMNAGSPPPPSVRAIEIVGLAGFVVIGMWAWWADRHRDPRA